MADSELIESLDHFFKVSGGCSLKIYKELEMSELTIKQIEQLKVIRDHESLTHSELVEITNLSKPTVTEMINKFIKNGCAIKEKSPTDKRSYYIKLTDRGLKIAKSNELSLEKLIQKMLSCLTEDEIKTFIKLVKKIPLAEQNG